MENRIKFFFCLGDTRADCTSINQKSHCAAIFLTDNSQRTLPRPVKAESLNVNKIAFEVQKHEQISIFAVKHKSIREMEKKNPRIIRK